MFVTNFSKGRGTVIYVKSAIHADREIELDSDFEESVWIKIKLRNNDTLLVGCVYRSPNCTKGKFYGTYSYFIKLKC